MVRVYALIPFFLSGGLCFFFKKNLPITRKKIINCVLLNHVGDFTSYSNLWVQSWFHCPLLLNVNNVSLSYCLECRFSLIYSSLLCHLILLKDMCNSPLCHFVEKYTIGSIISLILMWIIDASSAKELMKVHLIMVPCCHLLPGVFFFPLPNVQPVGENATIRS